MKTSKRNKLFGLVLTGGFSLFGASNAFAAAGDNISNFATLQYSVGTTPQTVIESGSGAGNSVPGAGYAVANGLTTDFLEDRVINFTVVRENGSAVPVAPGSSQQAIPYLIDNTGNATHGFLLAGVHNSGALDPFGGAADSFTPTTIQTYVDTDGNGVLDPAEIAATNTYIPSFAPGAGTATGGSSTGAEIRVFVVSDIPLDEAGTPLATDDIAVMSLVAHAASDGTDGTAGTAITIDDNGHYTTGGTFTNGTATVANASGSAVTNADDPTNMETVFNDGAFVDGVTGATVDGAGAVDIVSNAQASSYSSYTVLTAALTVAKASTTLWDPVNDATSPKSIPGGYVTYSISVANAAGAADAALTTLTDILPAALVLDPDFVTNAGPGNPTSGTAGDSIQVIKGATTIYCTAAADNNGCNYAANTVTVDLSNTTFATIMPLVATETVTVNFNGIVQ